MPVTVVVGGQYGSEAKGKMVAHLAETEHVDLCIRTGGPNAGHTVYIDDQKYITRQIPSALVHPTVRLAIGAGGVVDIELLKREINELHTRFGIDVANRLFIDGDAAIVDTTAANMESTFLGLTSRIGSTGTGTGWAQSQRILRSARLARDVPDLRHWVTDVAVLANKWADTGAVVVEGTQGFGLSLLHGKCYPFCTSRDTSASGFLSEAGLAPSVCNRTIMVIRSYPIRVGGNSGPLFCETDWSTVQQESGYPWPITEVTSVTGRVRRVGRFDWLLLRRACMVNRPTAIALHGADYISFEDYGKTCYGELTVKTKAMVEKIEDNTGVPVLFVFTGPEQRHLVDRLQPIQAVAPRVA